MSDDVVQRARQALDGITPGPWRLPATLLGSKNGTVFADDNDSDTPYQVAVIASTRGDADGRLIAAAPQLVADLADEVEKLRVWRSEALTVTAGLQDLGKALGVPLGHRITGPDATERAQALVAEVKKLRAEKAAAERGLIANRDAAIHMTKLHHRSMRERYEAVAERDRLRATITRVEDALDDMEQNPYANCSLTLRRALDGEVQ
ncbi:MAG: hypothetical protein WBA38_04220 [Gordonia sp. (in: high G+C Gram-positive bacteria)]|uniref:hypothetical protein n=1 Tax=Gordonia sp. (in: high G+C Gram-positive bacteria) TaxID=84139 RepID=UPI003C773150